MSKTFMKLGIRRDNNFMYYIKNGAVWAVPRKKPGVKAKGKKKKVVQFAKSGELDYTKNLYFVDGKGNVAVASRKKARKTRKK